MKTYILSVNTLMWNLTSERHDNCAPCLGLILPIRWVTPPPNVLLWSVSLMALPCYVFTFGLASISTCLHDYLHYVDYIDIYILVFCPLQHSLIAMSSCWIFWTKWMWSDPNLSMLYSTQSIHKFFMCVLFETRSKSSLCPCQLKNLRTELLSYLIQFSALPLKPFRFPRYTYLFTHDLTRSPLLSTWVTHVMRMRRVKGTFVQFLRANRFSLWL